MWPPGCLKGHCIGILEQTRLTDQATCAVGQQAVLRGAREAPRQIRQASALKSKKAKDPKRPTLIPRSSSLIESAKSQGQYSVAGNSLLHNDTASSEEGGVWTASTSLKQPWG